ncbi:reverse transcriptase (rna-dependent dna polymerase) [Holotrichia oblita]|uniref:Reverse transcriptase (Rna-dependent dna polymerase) n=1 Tax=Holotrichia oblita TaxID=644536 RepID=A0ACB9TE46_HOLOL|nr:reverse transcriptase (rna-dependent dna polymerase) [Holotrichia oblita]
MDSDDYSTDHSRKRKAEEEALGIPDSEIDNSQINKFQEIKISIFNLLLNLKISDPFHSLTIEYIEPPNKNHSRLVTKPTFSGRYLKYYSNHPMQTKLNFLRALRNRMIKIAHPQFHDSIKTRLTELFLQNGYPKNLVKSIVYQSHSNQQPTIVHPPQFTLPF